MHACIIIIMMNDVCVLYVAYSAVGQAAYGQGTGDILLDDVQCTGTETSLVDCPNRGLGVHNCAHFEDAGVVCLSELLYFVWSSQPEYTI